MNWISIYISLVFMALMVSHGDMKKESYSNVEYRSTILKKVNQIRKNGCFCGRKYMPPTTTLEWNETLYKSAMGHAKEMTRYNFFAHFSKDGDDIGDRLEEYGYNWQVAGENLGEGQKSFEEVLRDWQNSKSHCIMLMNPKVNEMAVATHGRFWVQHFGKKMPPKSKRGKIKIQ